MLGALIGFGWSTGRDAGLNTGTLGRGPIFFELGPGCGVWRSVPSESGANSLEVKLVAPSSHCQATELMSDLRQPPVPFSCEGSLMILTTNVGR